MRTRDYRHCIEKARKAGACKGTLKQLPATWKEFTQHEDAPDWCYWYAEHVIQGRFPEGEAIIIKDPSCACQYELDVVQGHWPEGADAIARLPKGTYAYCCSGAE